MALPFTLATRSWNLLAGFVLSAAVFLAGKALLDSEVPEMDTPFSKRLVRASYDWSFHLTRFAQPDLSACDVVIIYIDEVSLNDLHQPLNAPMDRSLHAQLLQRLTSDGAKAVAMDIVFDSPGPNAETDAYFAKAIRDNGRVILGVDFNAEDQHQRNVFRKLTLPYAPFAEAAAGFGLVKFRPDGDFLARQHFHELGKE